MPLRDAFRFHRFGFIESVTIKRYLKGFVIMKKIGALKTYSSDEIKSSYVSIGFECLDRDLFNPEKCYDLLQKTGVKYARCQTGWVKCEKQKGAYDFGWLDSIVDNLLSRGIQPWFDVGFGNPLYMKNTPNEYCVGCVPVLFGEEAYEAWKKYVAALVKRFGDRVTCYEIWNEPNLDAFWYPGSPDAKIFAEFVQTTSNIIKTWQKDARTGVNLQQEAIEPPMYLDTFLENSRPENLDFFCYHMYTDKPEQIGNKSFYSFLRKELDKYGFTDTEIWQGEGGYPSWAYEGHWLVPKGCDSERAQAVYQLRRYFIDIFNGAKLSSFFQMADMWEKPYPKARDFIEKAAAHGILNGKTYTPKESYRTIAHLSAFFSGSIKPSEETMLMQLKNGGKTVFEKTENFTFEKDGKPAYVYYFGAPLDMAGDLTYTADLTVGSTFENPTLIDMYTGDVYEIESYSQHNGMCAFENLPVKNYPLVVAEKGLFELA